MALNGVDRKATEETTPHAEHLQRMRTCLKTAQIIYQQKINDAREQLTKAREVFALAEREYFIAIERNIGASQARIENSYSIIHPELAANKWLQGHEGATWTDASHVTPSTTTLESTSKPLTVKDRWECAQMLRLADKKMTEDSITDACEMLQRSQEAFSRAQKTYYQAIQTATANYVDAVKLAYDELVPLPSLEPDSGRTTIVLSGSEETTTTLPRPSSLVVSGLNDLIGGSCNTGATTACTPNIAHATPSSR